MTRDAAATQPSSFETGSQARGPAVSCLKILVLTPQFPYPPHKGTTIRNYNLIVHLARRHRVCLLSFGDPAATTGTPLHELCQSVEIVRPPRRSMRDRLAGLFFSPLPDMAQRLPSAQFRAALAATLERENPDVVQVEGIELAQYLFQVAARRTSERPLLVFDDHNAEYVLQQRAFETDARSRQPRRWPGAAYSLVQWRRLRRYERRACRAASRVVSVSEVDAAALRALAPGLPVSVVPNGVDMALYTSPIPALEAGAALPGATDLAFTGTMDFRPNVDAVLWFVDQVLPSLSEIKPGLRLWVVGSSPHERLAALAGDPRVVVTGRVEDVRPYIAAAGVYVVPLRIGGGTRLKVLEAMAMGKAIVSTRLGCEGFDVVPGQDLVVADSPTEFAAAILSLLDDPERRERLGRAARRYAGSRYDWGTIVPRLERTYQVP